MNTTIQLKLKRLQTLRSDEQGVLSSLRALSTFHEPALVPHENRRMLRGAIETRSVRINDDFLQVFDALADVRATASAVRTGIDVADRAALVRAARPLDSPLIPSLPSVPAAAALPPSLAAAARRRG